MNKEFFEEKKAELIRDVTDILSQTISVEVERESLLTLLGIINQYSFESRLENKGCLTRAIIDSLEVEYSIGDKFIGFDEMIK